MKILIASDSHDNWENLKKAIAISNERGCEHFLFAGDFMSPPGLKLFEVCAATVHFVWGNNDGEKMMLTRLIDAAENMTLHGAIMEETFDNLRFYMNHYPEFATHAARSGDYDVCVYGHTHDYVDETLENGTRLLNPGEVQGYKHGTPTCMVFDTGAKEAEKISL